MKFTQIFTVVAFAVTTIAAPTVDVERRTDSGPVAACSAIGGTLSCCTQKQDESGGSLQTALQQYMSGLLGVVPSAIPQILPKVAVAVQCVAVVANVIPCGSAAICCSGGVNANNVYDPTGLVNLFLLSNDNLALCPGVTA